MTLIDSSDQTDPAVFDNQKPITGGENLTVMMHLKNKSNVKNESNLKFVCRCLSNFIRYN